jgi:hypothetical protein
MADLLLCGQHLRLCGQHLRLCVLLRIVQLELQDDLVQLRRGDWPFEFTLLIAVKHPVMLLATMVELQRLTLRHLRAMAHHRRTEQR